MKYIGYILLMVCLLTACEAERLSDDPNLHLSFSVDSINFDTVFTTIGSSTKQVLVYNHNKNAVEISSITHASKYFYINLDGENKEELLRNVRIEGGDSLFMFVRVEIDPQSSNSPVLIEDTLLFAVNGHTDILPMRAYGQNVHIIQTPQLRTNYTTPVTFTATKPYLIFDTIVALDKLIIEPGASLYLHNNTSIYAFSDVEAQGTQQQPIRILGDRTDRLFDNVPYAYASGQWGGVFLMHVQGEPVSQYVLNHVELQSGTIGLYCQSEDMQLRSSLQLLNSRIHNCSAYGLVLINTDAEVANSEISNCASFCVYSAGGHQVLTHNTIASYFGYPYTTINIHNHSREDVPAVYIYNEIDSCAPSDLSIHNCIITGANSNNLLTAVELTDDYPGEITGNYLKADTLHVMCCHDNVYAQDSDSVFTNIFYRYGEYKYYNFHLHNESPARQIADSILALPYPYDRDGLSRQQVKPDAGCYQYTEHE